jgi:alanine racemase
MKSPNFRTWVEIDPHAIGANVWSLKSLLGENIPLMAVVKSNAYGHGMVESALIALGEGASWLAVDEITEAIELRKNKIKAPILVLGYTLPELYKDALAHKISITISSLEALQNLSKEKLKKGLKIHLKFDTGLHRQGIPESHVQQAIRLITTKGFPATIEGAYTHFAVMEDPMRESYSKMQAEAFKSIVEKIKSKNIPVLAHASASSGILFSKNFHFDISRGGIALYGLWPSREIKLWAKDVKLIPALAWKTIVTEVKLVSKGAKVGYDLTHEMLRNSRLAIIPVGYWHGLPRNLSSKGEVLLNGKRAPIVGRISMDMAIIDVTDIPNARPGDEVVIIGTQGKESITAEEVALKAGTINYEIVTRINPLIPRIILTDAQKNK